MQAANQCPNCGAAVRLGAKFCGGCGAQLSTPVWTQPQQTVPIQQYSSAVEYQRGGSQTIAGTRVSISWTGSGGDLFWKLLGWMLLSLITLGIYYPWTICNLMKYMVERTMVQTS